MTKNRQKEILRQINKALEWQFQTYSWEDMINDCMLEGEFTKEEIKWAKEHTGYKAYIC